MKFGKNYEQLVNRVIAVETSALNSEKGGKIMAELLEKAKEQNPNLTAEEWSKTKESFLVAIFYEILKESPQLMTEFIGHMQTEANEEEDKG